MLVNPDEVQGCGYRRTYHNCSWNLEKKVLLDFRVQLLKCSTLILCNVLHLWLSTKWCRGCCFLHSVVQRHSPLTDSWAWSYLFSLLSLLYPENVEVHWVAFRGLRGWMHWDTNVLKRQKKMTMNNNNSKSRKKEGLNPLLYGIFENLA